MRTTQLLEGVGCGVCAWITTLETLSLPSPCNTLMLVYMKHETRNLPPPLTLYFMHMCFAVAIAEMLNCKVFVSKDKKRIIDCLESEEILQIIESNDPVLSPLHVLPMHKLNIEVSSNVIVLSSCVFMSHVIILM